VLNNLPQTQAQSLLILNPIRSQEPYNRTGLIESLLQITRKNLDAGQNQINVFELNKIYLRSKNTKNTKAHQITTQIQEKVLLGILSTELNMQDLATIMHQILFKIKQNIHEFHGFKDDLALNGYIGNNDEVELKIYQLNNSAKKKFGISLSKNISYLEFDLTNWSRQINSFEQYREDREFPDLKRTLSFFVPHSLSFASVKSVIANLEVIQKHEFEVVVEGLERISGAEVEDLEDQIFTPDILNFTLKLNHPSRTITGEEGLEVEESILSALQANYSSKIARR
jgi:phenylalanyl-tRNA synthetase beta subunit